MLWVFWMMNNDFKQVLYALSLLPIDSNIKDIFTLKVFNKHKWNYTRLHFEQLFRKVFEQLRLLDKLLKLAHLVCCIKSIKLLMYFRIWVRYFFIYINVVISLESGLNLLNDWIATHLYFIIILTISNITLPIFPNHSLIFLDEEMLMNLSIFIV